MDGPVSAFIPTVKKKFARHLPRRVSDSEEGEHEQASANVLAVLESDGLGTRDIVDVTSKWRVEIPVVAAADTRGG